MRVIRLDTIDSTMLEARRLLAAGEEPPFTVIAEQQTGGIGRLGRPWSSPRGGWWFTVAAPLVDGHRSLCSDAGLEIALLTCLICDGAMVASIGVTIPELSIKWPNDVMAGDMKLAGVLIEVIPTVAAAAGAVALVGVGVNANMDVADLDSGLRDKAASLRSLLNRDVDRSIVGAVLTVLAGRIAKTIARTDPEPDRVARVVRRRLWGVGRTVPITMPDGTRVSGRIDGITDDGNLLATIDGEQRTLRSVDQIG